MAPTMATIDGPGGPLVSTTDGPAGPLIGETVHSMTDHIILEIQDLAAVESKIMVNLSDPSSLSLQ